MFNLSPDDRSLIEQQLPEIVTKQLIPIDWKDKWAPMKTIPTKITPFDHDLRIK